MNDKNQKSLVQLVEALPEIYQPIFGHNELSKETSRTCSDRMSYIGDIYALLESELGRPLRVLDLGCAQGFFSLSLAQKGASVRGVDFLDKNIAVCQALADEHEGFDLLFEVGRIEQVLETLQEEQYDLVLGLSVFHHIVHEHGLSTVREMLKALAKKVKVGIFELALASEPLYWGASQPLDPRVLLDGFSCVRELAEHATHLSSIVRPLFVSSNFYWFLDNKIGSFNTYTDESHKYTQGTHALTRRYFFSDALIVKFYKLHDENRAELKSRLALNVKEFQREVDFLLKYGETIDAPKLLSYEKNQSEAWIVREKLEGKLLLNMIESGESFDTKRVIEEVLRQLVALEKEGLYYDDLRTWNVLLTDSGEAKLIDFGAISTTKADCVWPDNIFLSFLVFVKEVSNLKIFTTIVDRGFNLHLDDLVEPYRSLFISFFNLPEEALSFAKFSELLSLQGEHEVALTSGFILFPQAQESYARIFQSSYEKKIAIVEKSLAEAKTTIDAMHKNMQSLQAKVMEAEASAEASQIKRLKAEEEVSKAEELVKEVQTKNAQVQAKSAQVQAQNTEVLRHYHDIENSRSWKMTKPLRLLGIAIRRVIAPKQQIAERQTLSSVVEVDKNHAQWMQIKAEVLERKKAYHDVKKRGLNHE